MAAKKPLTKLDLAVKTVRTVFKDGFPEYGIRKSPGRRRPDGGFTLESFDIRHRGRLVGFLTHNPSLPRQSIVVKDKQHKPVGIAIANALMEKEIWGLVKAVTFGELVKARKKKVG